MLWRSRTLRESRMEAERHQVDGKVLQNLQKSFGEVHDILEKNRVLISRINWNQESKQVGLLSQNVSLIRELNDNIRTVAALYGDLSESCIRAMGISSEGESDAVATNQKRFRSG